MNKKIAVGTEVTIETSDAFCWAGSVIPMVQAYTPPALVCLTTATLADRARIERADFWVTTSLMHQRISLSILF